MREPLCLDLPYDTRRLLDLMAEGGIVGQTPEEVAAYLITREIDDMMRCGALSIETVPATPNEGPQG